MRFQSSKRADGTTNFDRSCSIMAQHKYKKYFRCVPPGTRGFPNLAAGVSKWYAGSDTPGIGYTFVPVRAD